VRRPRATALALAALLAAASGCLVFRPPAPEPGLRQGAWAEIRDAATRRYVLYDGVTHRANATAAHLTPAVREARVRRLAEWKNWTDAEVERQLVAERAAAATGEEFLVAFYTAQLRNNDLDGRESIWHVSVRKGETEAVASEIHSVRSDAEVRNLFPWIGPFDTLYTIRFPPFPDGPLGDRGFVLAIAGAVGKLPLDYDLPPVPNLPQLLPAPPEQR
jgi:hypothetical protein